MSGFVASENSGCSIDAMSSFGTASAMSRTKKSSLGADLEAGSYGVTLTYQELFV
jgi:hypothetical protein